jgi:predicted DNA-binding transcriptional regulator AlpA
MAVVKMSSVPAADKEYLNQAEAAALIGVHVNFMVLLSRRPDGPPRTKLGPRAVRYRRCDLVAWMESRKESVAA